MFRLPDLIVVLNYGTVLDMIECEESAYKHWYTRAQIDYIFRHSIERIPIASRVPGDRVVALLGYPDEFEEKRSEIFISMRSRKVFHAMECVRPQWQHYFDEHENNKETQL